jgi:Raf kinase inhibitor-like YbhB/YbcL family protein
LAGLVLVHKFVRRIKRVELMLQQISYSLILFILLCVNQKNNQTLGGKIMEIRSSAFKDGGFIPEKYTCDGLDISPPLEWSQVPDGTKSFTLICDDPDAPMGTWVHWVLYNLPGNTRELAGKVPPLEVLENGARQGRNDFRRIGYGGPCPPRGTHRYYFKIYALDQNLDIGAGISVKELIGAMEGHVLAEGQLMGKYKR